MDPALLAVNHFCRAIGAHIHCRTIFGNPHGFASDLVAIEKRAGLDIVLMPWRRPVAYLGEKGGREGGREGGGCLGLAPLDH